MGEKIVIVNSSWYFCGRNNNEISHGAFRYRCRCFYFYWISEWRFSTFGPATTSDHFLIFLNALIPLAHHWLGWGSSPFDEGDDLILSQKHNPTLEDRREEKQGKRKPHRVFVRREFDVVSSGIGSASLKAISIDRILYLHERVIFKCETDAMERYRKLTAASEGGF